MYPIIPEDPQIKTLPIKVKVSPNKCKSPNFIGFCMKRVTALTQERQNPSEEMTIWINPNLLINLTTRSKHAIQHNKHESTKEMTLDSFPPVCIAYTQDAI